MLEVVLAAVVSVASLTPVRDLTFPDYAVHGTLHLSYAYDDLYDYLGTPDGLFRTRDLLDPWQPLDRIGFEGRPVSALAVGNGMLYVQTGESDWATDPTLFRSGDRGESFTPIADDLRLCPHDECGYLPGRQLKVDGDRVFLEAAGNFFVSGDEGASWQFLHGQKHEFWERAVPSLCGTGAFEVVGRRLFMGAVECVDLVAGTLSPDRLGWSAGTLARGFDVADMDHQRIHVLRSIDGTTIFAGTSHGLRRSDDGGVSFREVFGEDIQRRYFGMPPVHHLIASTRHPNLMLAGAHFALECSNDSGETWTICTWLWSSVMALPDMPPLTAPSLALLSETRDGDLFLAARVRDRFVVAKVNIGHGKRRAAAHGE